MENPHLNRAEQTDNTQEISGLLENFANLQAAILQNHILLNRLEATINLPSDGAEPNSPELGGKVKAMLEAQRDAAQQNEEGMRKTLDKVAAELREKGQGLAVEGYEARLSNLE